ncbi:alpha/beta hydrolase [Clostridium neuense]|uniref:Alpha/beta hydrolase n=1 Tax=Clostridium neuense TaxID=1728934 RepID=A0ABW8TFK4_9CLOT
MSSIIKSQKFDEVYGEYYSDEKAKSLAVIFPGLKYGHDKPLLHYARKAAQESEKDVLCLNYEKKLDWDDIGKPIIDTVADECLNILKEVMKKEYKSVYFLSKSIGTEVAGNVAGKFNYSNTKFLYLTPTQSAVKYICKSKCFAIAGTNDNIFKNEYIEKIKKSGNVKLMLVEGGNHSLELSNNLIGSIDVLKNVVKAYIDFFEED